MHWPRKNKSTGPGHGRVEWLEIGSVSLVGLNSQGLAPINIPAFLKNP
jgi:hypothetical protein